MFRLMRKNYLKLLEHSAALIKYECTSHSVEFGTFFKSKSTRSFSSIASLNLSGIYPPIVTTFDENGNVTLDKLKHNLQKWETVPFRGYVILGSTGEFPYLSEEEKLTLVKYVKENVSSEKLIIVGTGNESTNGTVNLTNKMADVGASAALVVSPFFYKGRMTQDTLYDHYMKVADASKIPVILYSVPANTGIDLSAQLVVKLSHHPNIIGLKDSGGDIQKIGHIICKTKENGFQVLAGSAGFLYAGLCVGCVGGVLALANPLGPQVCKLYELFHDDDHEQASYLQHLLIEPNLAVTKKYGIPGVKAAMDLLGYHGGFCRPPLKSLTPEEVADLKKEFKENGFLSNE
ncbi:4-hydroxy-2-oxoglutarate aldolase, mitochondrial-like [Uloborus diversus]|uniref:4-hydroxy-2-oxoglutarate aldolase, mitochondrial-like n=1 Tax=Uloborus diversus TaxID=327109 RepID=UPI00240A87C3|nr:4-hydroxy-2-oxoglutarate aldolase, mitochondrial-like [Uloborus diversus]